MKKIGTTALAVLTALSLTCGVVGCSEKKKEAPKTEKPADPKPADKPADKPAGGGH